MSVAGTLESMNLLMASCLYVSPHGSSEERTSPRAVDSFMRSRWLHALAGADKKTIDAIAERQRKRITFPTERLEKAMLLQ